MSKDIEGIITFRTKKKFVEIKQQIESLNQLNLDVRRFSRYFFGNTLELNPDKSGRVTIPKDFLEHAAIKKNVVFLGLGSKFELCSLERYRDFEASYVKPQALEELVKRLEVGGIKL